MYAFVTQRLLFALFRVRIAARAEFNPQGCPREIDLLPFHRLGESKYAVIQQPYTMPDATVPQEHIDALAALLQQRGFIVSIGG